MDFNKFMSEDSSMRGRALHLNSFMSLIDKIRKQIDDMEKIAEKKYKEKLDQEEKDNSQDIENEIVECRNQKKIYLENSDGCLFCLDKYISIEICKNENDFSIDFSKQSGEIDIFEDELSQHEAEEKMYNIKCIISEKHLLYKI